MDGAIVGSREICFRMPSNVGQRGASDVTNFRFLKCDTQTAGSICLLLQAALPYALVSGDTIRWIFKGGTNASMAPQYDYWEHVFLPTIMQQFHISSDAIQSNVIRRGFFPKGGGEVHVTTQQPFTRPLPPISLIDRGEVTHVWIRSFCAGNCPKKVAEAMAGAAKDYLEAHVTIPNISVEIVHEKKAVASGSGILIVATTSHGCRLGGSALGSPKTSPEQVGTDAASELCSTLTDGGCVDEYLQDQLIIYMALAQGKSEIITGSLTLHTRTAIWTAEQCCDARFHVERRDDKEDATPDAQGRISGRYRISCIGIGYA